MLEKENKQSAARLFGAGRRLCALILSFVLLLGLFPVTAFAKDVLKGSSSKNVSVSTAEELKSALESLETQEIRVDINNDIRITQPIILRPNAKITLYLNEHRVEGRDVDGPWFTVSPGAELTIIGRNGSSMNKGYLESAEQGVAVVENNGTLRLGNATYVQNCKADKGGAIYVKNGGTVELGSSYSVYSGLPAPTTFFNCEAKQGGAVYVEEGGTVLNGSFSASFEQCKAEQGGGVYVAGGKVELDILKSCSATQGGAIYIEKGTVSVSKLSENTADQGGGVYCNGNCAFDLNDMTMNDNSATQGGGVYVAGGGVVTVERTGSAKDRTITGNKASGNGGAFYVVSGGKVSLANVTMKDNTADYSGGAIYVESPAETNSSALLTFNSGFACSGNKAGEAEEDVYLTAATAGQIGASDLSKGTNIKVSVANGGGSKEIIKDIASLEFFTLNGQIGSAAQPAASETGEAEDFATLKATLEAGKSVKLAADIECTETITIPESRSGEVLLDLNGKTLKASSELSGRMITVASKAIFHVVSDAGKGYFKNAPAGAVEVTSGGTLNIGKDVSFSDCTALRGGGVLVDNGGIMVVTGDQNSYSDCKATGQGGGVFVDAGGSLALNGNFYIYFYTCSAGSGGGLYLEKGSLLANDVMAYFRGCKASGCGGGVYTATSGTLRSLTYDCEAVKGGGVFVAPGAEFTSYTLRASGDKASGNGGGAYISSGATLSTLWPTIESSSAQNGGGVYVESDATFHMENRMGNQTKSNRANQNGGFLYLEKGAAAWVEDGAILNNTAGGRGGAIYVEAGAEKNALLEFKNLRQMSGNTASGKTEDLYLAGPGADQVNTDGIADGVKITTALKRDAERVFLKNQSDLDHFVFNEEPDYYLLRVETGTNSGRNVLYFGVRYLDADGIERTQFIYPQEASLSESYELAGGLSEVNNRVAAVNRLTGYSIGSPSGDNAFVYDENKKGLQSDSTDYYAFKPRHEFDQLIGIDVFMRYDKDLKKTDPSAKQDWTCQGMYFYHVDEFYGVKMAGYFTNQLYISFSGQLLGRLLPQNGQEAVSIDTAIEESGKLYRIGRDENTKWNMEILKYPTQYDSKSEEYLFELEFADYYGAGIEALATDYVKPTSNPPKNGLKGIVEALVLEVEYKDNNNKAKTVKMPVVVNSVSWAVENGYLGSDLPVVGVAQQGERLMFVGALPDVKEITRYSLFYGEGAAKEAEIVLNSASAEQNNRLTRLKNETDTCSLTAVHVYSGDALVNASSSAASFDLSVDESCVPIYSYASDSTLGDTVRVGKAELNLSPFDSTRMRLRPAKEYGGYLVSITTDSMERAATVNDITVNLHYVSQSGEEKSTGDLNASDYVGDFYGYWPGVDGNVAYQSAMRQGRELLLMLYADDVSYFTGATLTIKKDAMGNVDDWQMKDLRIMEITSIGKRMAEWKDIGYSDREFSRNYTVFGLPLARYPNALDSKTEQTEIVEEEELTPEELEYRSSGMLTEEDLGKVYLSKENPSVTITFSGTGASEVGKAEDPDWEALRYSMTYEQTHMDLKFGTTMCEYTVKVKVGSNINASEENGDAGSNNLFYFMLAFENGTSAYVLANQQLAGDGFRAETTETFKVKTNRDYGAVTAVYIIPDDSNEELATDKLNVESIVVVKDSTDGISKMWTVSNVGWIGGDYYDRGAENTMGGRPARSESEVAKIFYVDKKGYSTNLLFALKTGSYEAVDASGKRVENKKVAGTIMMAIDYKDNTGTTHYGEPIDVAEAIYEYANQPKKYYSEATKTHAQIDSFMLRGGKTDRFIVPIENLQQIISVKFSISPEVSTVWRMEHLDIFKIESDGLVQINTKNEYQRSNKTTWLCSGTESNKSLPLDGPNGEGVLGAEQPLQVQLTQHKIEVDMLSSSWTSTITRAPISKDDKLNVYVYMNAPIAEGRNDYSMKANVLCFHPLQGDYSVPTDKMNLAANRQMFYMMDITANGIDGVSQVTLKANDSGTPDVPIDRVVVQHTRSGVTMQTYVFEAGNQTAYPLQVTLDSPRGLGSAAEEQQTVKLFFSEDTPKQSLENEIDDILVSIRYRSTNDVQRSGGGTSVEYSSKYVYLTDVKESVVGADGQEHEKQKYTSIRPGMIAEIPFNEACVDEIVSISLASSGSIDATVDSACVLCTGNDKEPSWYNFANGTKLSYAPFTLSTSRDETVTPVKMTFETTNGLVDMGESNEVGAEIPIRMTVCYCNKLTNALDSVTFENLKTYVTDGGFQSGDTATVEFFLKNLKKSTGIRYITLEPLSAYSIGASWGLGTVACATMIGGEERNYDIESVNKMILQGYPEQINLATLNVCVNLDEYSEKTGTLSSLGATVKSSDKDVRKVLLTPGRTLYLTPKVEGTLNGYGFKVCAVEGEVERTTVMSADATLSFCNITSEGTKVVFAPPAKAATYTIRIISEEMPEYYCDVIVTVSGLPDEEVEEFAAPVKASDTEEEKSDEGGSGEGGTPPETPPEA